MNITNIWEQVVAALILAIILAIWAYLRKHRREISKRISQTCKHNETDEEVEARRHREMIESDDPDIWKPLK